MGSVEQKSSSEGLPSRRKLASNWKGLAVGVFVVGIVFILPILYEPSRIPDYLDRVLFQTSYSGTPEQTIELLNENSTYHSNPSDQTSREIVTGLTFSRSADVLVIEHSRHSASAVARIRKRIEDDEEFLWWKLAPNALKKREKDKGSDTPSWQDAVAGLARVGFTGVRLRNRRESWDIPLHSSADGTKK